MSESKYFRVRLNRIAVDQEESLTLLCFEHGASGISEALAFTQPDLTYDPKILFRREKDLDVFFPESPKKEFFDAINAQYPTIAHSVHEEEQKDWLAEWKKGFVSFKLVGDFWVVPSWLEAPEGVQKTIVIDPGMAFGTGTHATTQMMAYFIHRLAKKNPEGIKALNLLDVGTGTGILAILAHQLGFKETIGLEIDPEARRVGKENILLNKANTVEIPEKQLDEIHRQFDVVVANIIDGVLIKLKKDLIKAVKPGGYLLLTGILEERDSHFFENFIEGLNFQVVQRLEKDEWVGYWLQAPQE